MHNQKVGIGSIKASNQRITNKKYGYGKNEEEIEMSSTSTQYRYRYVKTEENDDTRFNLNVVCDMDGLLEE